MTVMVAQKDTRRSRESDGQVSIPACATGGLARSAVLAGLENLTRDSDSWTGEADKDAERSVGRSGARGRASLRATLLRRLGEELVH